MIADQQRNDHVRRDRHAVEHYLGIRRVDDQLGARHRALLRLFEDRDAVNDGIYDGEVGQGEPLLDKMQAQRPLTPTGGRPT